MTSSLIERLSGELEAIRAEGLYKHERVIASPQAGAHRRRARRPAC